MAKPTYGIGLVAAVVLLVAVAARPVVLVCILVFTLFVESVHIAPGLTADRAAGGLAIVVLAAYLFQHGLRGLRFNWLIGMVLAYGAWSLLSYYWSAYQGAALKVFVSYVLALAYMLAIAVMVRRVGDVQLAFGTMALGAFIFGLVAFVSYKSGTYRAAGLQGDPNFFAVFQTAALPPTLALAANERRPPVRAAYYAVVVVIMLSVVASLSRTGLLAFVGVVIVSLFLPWRFFRTRSRKAAYVVAICLLIPAVAAVGSTSFIKRADSIFHPNSVASDRGSGRTDIWRAALHGYSNHPWLGLGAGNFEKESLSLLETTPGVNTTAFYAQTSKVAHNAYIETLTELGPVGLAIFLAMLFLTGRTIMSAYRRARAAKERAIERYALALLLSFAALLVASTFLSDQLSKITWILIGLALALEVMTRNLAPVAALYHPVVHEAVEDPSDRRRSDEYAALRAERARLARLADELDARQRALAERAADLDAREEALARRAAEREQGHRS